MRILVLAALSAAFLSAAPALQIVKPVVSQIEGGAPDPPGFDHAPGEILYFWCRVAGFSKTEDEKVHVAFSVQAFDPKGLPLEEIYKDQITVEAGPNDKDWMPKISTTVTIPPLAAGGEYKIVVKAEDMVGRTSTELSVPLRVRGKDVAPSETLVIRNFHYYRHEDDATALEKPVYHAGDSIWARFDIIGYRYGEPNNKIGVLYSISVIADSGKVLWTQPEPAVDKSEAFYPKRFVPASMSIDLQKNFKPGEYKIGVIVKDSVGQQAFEEQYPFVVE
jgi:hypothetical protein